MPEWWILLAAFFVALFALIVFRVPFAFAFAAVSIGVAVWFYGWGPGMQTIVLGMDSALTTFGLTALPLFLLMGDILVRSGIATDALADFERLLARVPGRLGILATLGGAGFGMVSGSAMATTAVLGRSILPDMLSRGYNIRFGMGTIMGAGGLAMILPPSIIAVIWGSTAQVPIGPLFIGSIIPGLIMAVSYLILTIVWAKVGAAPADDPAGSRGSLVRRLATATRTIVPLVGLMAIVLGLILLGIATPTESAAVGAIAAVVLAAAFRRLTWRIVTQALMSSAKLTAMMLFIVAGSATYSQLMVASGATSGFVEALTGIGGSEYLVLAMMIAIVLILGTILDEISSLLITIPFFMPVVYAMGWDPVWFGVMNIIALQIGMLSPPFGYSLFIMKGIAPSGTKLKDIYLGALPFVASDCITITIIAAFPALVLWLPSLMLT